MSHSGGVAAEEVTQELELLKGVNAFATPGNLVALMGGSGAGYV
jgi:ABC-type multidrug transport system ATPase subunit